MNHTSNEKDNRKNKESTTKQNEDYLTFNEDLNTLTTKGNDNVMQTQPNNDIVHQKFKKLLVKLGFDEIEIKHNTITHTKTSIERCHLLYEKGKIKNEVNKLIFLKNHEIKEKQQLSECTFLPRTNSARKIEVRKTQDKFYDRAIHWKKTKEERKEKDKTNLKKEAENCTFKPKVNSRNIDNIFNAKYNILNDYGARTYMLRLQNARKEDNQKKSKFILTTKNFDKLQRRRYCTRSVSADRTGFSGVRGNLQRSIKNLHDELHTMTLEN